MPREDLRLEMAAAAESAETPEWEMAKENIQPIKAGRKVTRLTHRGPEMRELEIVHLEEIEKSSSAEEKLKSWIRSLQFLVISW